MKIQRFFAPDIRQAMRMVKEELGADAVIMSNRSIDNGVEIVAARDFDEQLIHDGVKKQQSSPESEKPAAGKKAILPDFQADKKSLHVLSNKRKRQVDGSVPDLPPRKKIQQYIGYAEKVALNSSKKSLSAADPELNKAILAGPSVKQQGPVRKSGQDENLLLEMRKELSYLRTALDNKLSETNWSQGKQSNPIRIDLLRRLADMGIAKKLGIKIANRLGNHTDSDLAWRKTLEMLETALPIEEDNLLTQGGIAALVGPTGVGKTTTIAKLAAKFILQHGPQQVALITTDNYRIAAHEQLNTYGRILDVPVRVATNADELHTLINSFYDKRLILIDTAGMSQRDMRLLEQIEILQQDDIPIKTYLVMSATTQLKAMNEIVDAFQVFNPKASILTKLDEAALKGAAVSALVEQQLPLAFITDGQQVPEDLHRANAQSMIEHCTAELEQEDDDKDGPSYDDWVAQSYA